MEFKKISIVIPVYNEKKTILDVIHKVEKLDFSPLKKEIIIVDDYSHDGSKEILRSLSSHKIFFHKINQGKGAALRTGFKHATGDVITIQDADMEYNPEDLVRLSKLIITGRSEVVYGSRFLKKHQARYQFYYLGNKLLSYVTGVLYAQKVTDMETCYKMFTRKAYKSIQLTANRFEIEPEITAKFIKAGYKINEIPIKYQCRAFEEGKKITWWDGVQALYYLFKFKFE